MKLAYGDNADVLANKQVAAVQALSGTGACRLMAEFQNRYLPNSKVLIPKPTWSNHHNIWRDAQVPAGEFRYYKPETRGLDYEGMLEDLKVCSFGSCPYWVTCFFPLLLVLQDVLLPACKLSTMACFVTLAGLAVYASDPHTIK